MNRRGAIRGLTTCPCEMNQLQTSSCSKQDPSPLSMNDFWVEVEHIKQTQDSDGEENNCSEPSTPEEGEAEEDWLQDTGLSPLIGNQTTEEENVILLTTLTRTQTMAVQKRLDSYSRSLRKRTKHSARDVRDVFDKTKTRISDCLPDGNGIFKTAPPTVNGKTSKSSNSLDKVSETSNTFYTDMAYSEQAEVELNIENRMVWQPEILPNIEIQKGRLGVTRVSDLSPLDMKQVPALALIEVTALFDILDLELKRNKTPKCKATENKLFGVMLNNLLEYDQKRFPHTPTPIPLILQEIMKCLEKKGLDVQGILRIPGSQTRIKSLKQCLEQRFYDGLFGWDDVNPHDASGLLKLFLRELPTPLLTSEYLPAFTAVQKITDLKQRIQALNLLTLVLPEPNRQTLKALLGFLRKVASHEKSNLMSLWNISTIIAPNLFLYRGNNSKNPEGGEKLQAEGVAGVVMTMVHYQDLLWTVPTFLVSQVRKLNENSSKRYGFGDRRIRNFLRKIHTDKEKNEKNHTEASKHVKVGCSLFLKETLHVELNEGLKAKDVLQQFRKQVTQHLWQWVNSATLMKCNGSFEFPNLDLYEMGGNISERCLDPNTYLVDLQNVNPTGEWVIKPRPPVSHIS
ncbi:rho GTPase-activating protein 40 isoform X2 [Pelobates fuscus]|uniref:rho GTPase-activating protein 40 isoform X2 n=1 Tax=Pelobates fuscus TaxID=191477 RepID=UPI002FE43947